jgi:hypothetical protein
VSFILDALRKSESARRREAPPSIAHIPPAAPRSRTPAWVWIVMGALSIGMLGLAGAWWRSTQIAPQSSARATSAVDGSTSTPQPTQTRPATADLRALANVGSAAAGNEEARDAPLSASSDVRTLPSVAEVVADGVPLPPLELQLISYSEDAAERFVFINGFQYRQGQRVQNGPLVVSIYPEGVVLRHQEREFVLVPN